MICTSGVYYLSTKSPSTELAFYEEKITQGGTLTISIGHYLKNSVTPWIHNPTTAP